MKITNIETILAGRRYLFVKVHTDTGLVGYGECGAWCYQEATAECIHAMEHHLIGLDPLNIEYINNGLTRCMHFRGSVVMAAISGIDIANITTPPSMSFWAEKCATRHAFMSTSKRRLPKTSLRRHWI